MTVQPSQMTENLGQFQPNQMTANVGQFQPSQITNQPIYDDHFIPVPTKNNGNNVNLVPDAKNNDTDENFPC